MDSLKWMGIKIFFPGAFWLLASLVAIWLLHAHIFGVSPKTSTVGNSARPRMTKPTHKRIYRIFPLTH